MFGSSYGILPLLLFRTLLPDAAQSRASSGQTPVIPCLTPERAVLWRPTSGYSGDPSPKSGRGRSRGPRRRHRHGPRLAPLEQHPLSQRGPLLSPFRIFIGSTLAVRSLEFTAVSSYRRMASGYRSVTVSGQDGYIYLQKTLPFQDNAPVTVAVVQTAGGLDLVPISDVCCPPPALCPTSG